MHWSGWVVVFLVVFTGGFMTYDGARAFILGDYTTPSTGEYAGQLGPWTKIVELAGIEPRSTLMKSIFVIYGLAAISFTIAFILKVSWAWWGLLAVTILGLWFLPFGTIANLIALILLLMPSLRTS
jgi:hypothetical protein